MYTPRATSISLKCQGTPLRGAGAPRAHVGRIPELAAVVAPGHGRIRSVPSNGENGHVVAERLGGEVPSRLEQGLAQDGGILAGITADDAGDAILPEYLAAGP